MTTSFRGRALAVSIAGAAAAACFSFALPAEAQSVTIVDRRHERTVAANSDIVRMRVTNTADALTATIKLRRFDAKSRVMLVFSQTGESTFYSAFAGRRATSPRLLALGPRGDFAPKDCRDLGVTRVRRGVRFTIPKSCLAGDPTATVNVSALTEKPSGADQDVTRSRAVRAD